MACRRYLIELGSGLFVYLILTWGSVLVLRHAGVGEPWRSLVCLVPIIGAAGCCWAILRRLHGLDELQLRLQLEALAVAFAGTALLSISYGFLEGVGYPRLSMFVVWPLMAVLWGIGLLLARRRYQ
jgi:hypothetical protein